MSHEHWTLYVSTRKTVRSVELKCAVIACGFAVVLAVFKLLMCTEITPALPIFMPSRERAKIAINFAKLSITYSLYPIENRIFDAMFLEKELRIVTGSIYNLISNSNFILMIIHEFRLHHFLFELYICVYVVYLLDQTFILINDFDYIYCLPVTEN